MIRTFKNRLIDGCKGNGLGRMMTSLVLVGVGLLAGAALQPGAALGDVKDAAPAQAFQTGGQLSVPILKEIATTLHQMDARLQRLEAIAQQMKANKTTPAATK